MGYHEGENGWDLGDVVRAIRDLQKQNCEDIDTLAEEISSRLERAILTQTLAQLLPERYMTVVDAHTLRSSRALNLPLLREDVERYLKEKDKP